MTDKIGLTIEEAADYTGIGRNTMRKLVEWEKIPVLRIGRRYIIRIDVIHKFMEANQGADLLVREQVHAANEAQNNTELFICRFMCGML